MHRRLLPSTGNYGQVAWSDSGHLIYEYSPSAERPDLWAVPFSTKTLAPNGEPFLIARNAASPSVSRDGTLVYGSPATPPQKRLVWVDRTGKQVGDIGEPQLTMYSPAVSSDGRYVAVEGIESAAGDHIWIHDTVHPTKTRVTLGEAKRRTAVLVA